MTQRNAASKECRHRYTFKKEYLYQNVNVIFSKKICEKCGREIVLSRKSRTRIVLYIVGIVLLLFVVDVMLKQLIPGVSYLAKGLVVVLLFCVFYSVGLYKLMNSAEYVTYEKSERSSRYKEAYEKAREENDERTRLKYQQAAMKREQKRIEKEAAKK